MTNTDDLKTTQIEEEIKELARLFTEEHLSNPGPQEHLLIHNAMLAGWQLGIKQATAYMKENGISLL